MEPTKNRTGLILIITGLVILITAVTAVYFFLIKEPAVSTNPDASPPLVNDPSSDGVTTSVDVADGIGGGDDEGDEDFTITLTDGSAQDEDVEPLPLAATTPLTADTIQAIFDRLPEWILPETDQVDYRLPGDPIPPPLTGDTIDMAFPLDDEDITAPEGGYGPLEVLRYAPEGEVPIAPTINITFNQPMVPLATLAQLSEMDVPVEVSPEIPGTWRWIGTRTLRFNFDSTLIDRLPMATVYTVTIPAGTNSASGEELAQGVSWQFKTPPPNLVQSYPNSGPQGLEPIMFALFDQRIDRQVALAFINATADNQRFEVMLADESDYAEDKVITRLVENAPEGRFLVFKAVESLQPDSYIDIRFNAEMPSAEGPLATTSSQNFGFNTYPPLKIEEHGCSWYSSGEKCYPLAPWFIRFNNPLDPEMFEEGMVTIDPVLPGAVINISGRTLSIKGASVGNTNYRVTVSGDIGDIFGQTLGRNENLTFKVGKAEPLLFGPDQNLVTLDPSSTSPILSLYTINYDHLDLQVYRVEPQDWQAYLEYVQDYHRTDQPISPPGDLVLDDRIAVEGESNALTEVPIDLSKLMEGDYGHFFVKVKPPQGFFEEDRYWEQVNVWVQVTQIGLDVFSDQDEIITWTTALKDGAPLKDVEISSETGKLLARSGADGLARFDLTYEIKYIVASKDGDSTILPRSYSYWGSEWNPQSIHDNMHWYVYDDRSMYRPEEEVHIKGWMRVINTGPEGDVELLNGQVEQVYYNVFGPQGNEITSGSADVNALGGFDFNFTLPENVNLGHANIQLSASGSLSGIQNTYTNHSFQIQEFRRPEFEVNARNETTGPYFIDDEAVVAVEAAYYAGGPLPNAETRWSVNSSPTNYSPPNWPDFTFGTWVPWWYSYRFYDTGYIDYDGGYNYQEFYARTDATGNHYLKMTFKNNGEPRPYTVSANASVEDVNRQAWAGATSLLVHPADIYVGMKTESYYVDRDTPIEVQLIATDLDGNAVSDKELVVQAARMAWKNISGQWQEIPVEIQECTVTSQEEAVTCTFETPIGGRYQITALVTDDLGRQNQSQLTRWVSGGELPPSREVEKEEATLIPDQDTYQPGDTAKILVQSPFSPAEGLLTVTRNGILYTQRFTIEESTTTLTIPITEAYYPNLHIQVDLTGSAPRTNDFGELVEGVPPRPAYASGTLSLNIPPLGRTLAIEVEPRESKLSPGETTMLDLEVKDADGEPVEDAELAVVIVDEAILALTNYQVFDPISVFYYTRQPGLNYRYGRSSIILVDPAILSAQGQAKDGGGMMPMATQALGEMRSANAVMEESEMMADSVMSMEAPAAEPSVGGMGAGDAPTPIAVRTNFNPLAVFAPDVTTDANGKASVRVSLPDNLTRYRIMVIAVDDSGQQFGTGESSLTARLPLMVRPSASRFLNFGDQFEMPVVLQNQTDEDFTVDVVAQVGNLTLTDQPGYQVTVPANDRVEVRFPGETVSAGTARVQFAAVSGEFADAAQVSLPVYTPATTEAFATYGVVDDGVVLQPMAPPEGVIPIYGGLEITTSSTALQSLTDAFIYLVEYPFECSEQLASRILGIASLRDVLDAFDAEGLPSPEALDTSVEHAIEELAKLQNWDGGFPYWRRGRDSIPFNTVHVALALQRARMMGYEVPDQMWNNVLGYLRNIENYYPYWYSEKIKQTISAYALYVRLEMDDPDPAKASALLDDAGVEEISLEGLAWIWQVLTRSSGYETQLEQIRRHVNNQVVETAAAANFITGYDDNAYVLLHSNRRADAVLMDALISDNPDSDLIPKVVNGLLAHRKKGRWSNTQENVFVLMALNRYFNTFENVEPDFVARMWLGEDYLGAADFEGYSTDSYQLDVPMSFLVESFADGEDQPIILQKDGDGRLYYRLGLRYAPDDYKLPPLDMGFVVQREYEAIDDPEDVYQDEDGVWHIKAGARVRIRVTMVADSRRYHVALVDHLPAGLEAINPALAVSESVPQDPSEKETSFWWWYWTWYEHQNMRDERVEAFTTLLWDGVYEYTYETRATMPGTFIVPPAKAEEMYSPEVFGRSAADIVIVE